MPVSKNSIKVTRKAPAPVWGREGVELYHDTCENVLPFVPDESCDAVVTDPPYNVGFEYDGCDDTWSVEDYGKWMHKIIEHCERIAKPGAMLFFYQAMKNCRYWSDWFPRDYRIFNTCKNFAPNYPALSMQYAVDPAIVWWKPGAKPFSHVCNYSARDWFAVNTASLVTETWDLATGHPSPKILDCMEYVIKYFVKPKGKVLEPFSGSGTTLLACAKLGRSCIGIEQSRKYVDVAISRLKDFEGAGLHTDIRKQQAILNRKRKANEERNNAKADS